MQSRHFSNGTSQLSPWSAVQIAKAEMHSGHSELASPVFSDRTTPIRQVAGRTGRAVLWMRTDLVLAQPGSYRTAGAIGCDTQRPHGHPPARSGIQAPAVIHEPVVDRPEPAR